MKRAGTRIRYMKQWSLSILWSILLLSGLSAAADAQWTVVYLHPPGFSSNSFASGVGGGQQVGGTGYPYRNLMWTGTAQSWVDLNPNGADSSGARGVGGGQQVGSATFSNVGLHAGMWTGTAASWIDLHPKGSHESAAYGVSDGQQVGYAKFGTEHASLWTGSAESWVDLHPPGYWKSFAYGVSRGQQVGMYDVGSAHACLWTGSAASMVDLHPFGQSSQALGVGDGQQVGVAGVGNDPHAILWMGKAETWVDLNPSGATVSWSYGASGGRQTGYAEFGGRRHAGVWSGSAASWIDLHALLPAAFIFSQASAIWTDGQFTYVVGQAGRAWPGLTEAIMWVGPVGEVTLQPTGFSLFRGVGLSGGLAQLVNSDDLRFTAKRGLVQGSQESPITLRIDSLAPFDTASEFKIGLEAQVNSSGLVQRIDLYDYTINNWVNVDARAASTDADGDVTITATNPNRFIQPGTRAVRAQVRFQPMGPSQSRTWQAKVDRVRFLLTP